MREKEKERQNQIREERSRLEKEKQQATKVKEQELTQLQEFLEEKVQLENIAHLPFIEQLKKIKSPANILEKFTAQSQFFFTNWPLNYEGLKIYKRN